MVAVVVNPFRCWRWSDCVSFASCCASVDNTKRNDVVVAVGFPKVPEVWSVGTPDSATTRFVAQSVGIPKDRKPKEAKTSLRQSSPQFVMEKVETETTEVSNTSESMAVSIDAVETN